MRSGRPRAHSMACLCRPRVSGGSPCQRYAGRKAAGDEDLPREVLTAALRHHEELGVGEDTVRREVALLPASRFSRRRESLHPPPPGVPASGGSRRRRPAQRHPVSLAVRPRDAAPPPVLAGGSAAPRAAAGTGCRAAGGLGGWPDPGGCGWEQLAAARHQPGSAVLSVPCAGQGNARMIPAWPYSLVAALESGRTGHVLDAAAGCCPAGPMMRPG